MSETTDTTKSEKVKKTGVNLTPNFPTRELVLKRSGVTVTIPKDWTTRDTQEAQRYGAGDPAKINMALVQRVCRFDGKAWTMSDIQDRITGRDYMALLAELYSDDDEDDEGNA